MRGSQNSACFFSLFLPTKNNKPIVNSDTHIQFFFALFFVHFTILVNFVRFFIFPCRNTIFWIFFVLFCFTISNLLPYIFIREHLANKNGAEENKKSDLKTVKERKRNWKLRIFPIYITHTRTHTQTNLLWHYETNYKMFVYLRLLSVFYCYFFSLVSHFSWVRYEIKKKKMCVNMLVVWLKWKIFFCFC